MNNKKGGFGAKLLLVLILMIASAAGGAYGYRVLDGKLAVRDAMKAVEDVDISDYDSVVQAELQGYIDTAKKDLETAATRKDVYEVIGEFIADVAKVKTSNEKKLEEALRAAEEAKQRYSSNNNNSSQQQETASDDAAAEPQEPADNGSYSGDDLVTPGENEDSGGGLLGSLLGGMSSGAGNN